MSSPFDVLNMIVKQHILMQMPNSILELMKYVLDHTCDNDPNGLDPPH